MHQYINADPVGYASRLASLSDNPFHVSHVWEFKELATRVAQEQISEIVPQMINDAVSQAVNGAISNAFNDALKGIQIDVNRIVDITCKQLNKQYHSEEVSHFIAETLRDELIKGLSKIDVKLIIS